MVKIKLFILFLLCITCELIFAQKEGYNWYFGSYAGITFNKIPPVSVTNGALQTYEGCSTISDANGNLLFYTDGVKVWNKKNTQMPNGYGLNGDPSSTQSALIIPKPDDANTYYIFTVDDNGGHNGLSYSEVHLNLDGGLGDVATKNNLIYAPSAEKITAVKHPNGKDYWLITHRWNSDEFYVYLITKSGILLQTPVISAIGTVHSGDASASHGYMKVSPSGNKLALAIESMNMYELFNFNTTTGKVSNCVSINNQTYNSAYGVEFSVDEHYLYGTERWGTALWQFDLTQVNIPSSAKQIATLGTPYGGALQLGPDGKIYVARAATDYLGMIQDPTHASPTYIDAGLYLGGKKSYEGLPTSNVMTTMRKVDVVINSLCLNVPATFVIPNTSEITSVHWNFEYPSTSVSKQSTSLLPIYTYIQAGNYTIQLIVNFNDGKTETITKAITINPLPVVNLTANSKICKNGTLDAGFGFQSYQWNTGNQAQILPVSTAGTYSVTVSDGNGCTGSDDISVNITESPEISYTKTNVSTIGGTDGAINITVTKGTKPYTYNWSNGKTTEDQTSLAAGCYAVTVTDTIGCNDNENICITGPTGCDQSGINWEWAKSGGGKSIDQGLDIATDHSGNVYTIGSFSSVATFDSSSTIYGNSFSMYVAKYNSSGKLKWIETSKYIGVSTVNAIVTDENYNIYVIGHFSGKGTTFDGLPVSNATNTTIFIAKYDSSGNIQLLKEIKTIGGCTNDMDISIDNYGNIYTTGTFYDTIIFDGVDLISHGKTDIFVAKYNSACVLQWVKQAGGDDKDDGGKIATDHKGNCYVTGSFSGIASFDLTSVTSNGEQDIFMAKYNSVGEVQWVKSGGGINRDWAGDIVIDNSDNIYLTANFNSNYTFDSLFGKNFNTPSLFKYNSDGKILWFNSLETYLNHSYAMDVDLFGNVFITGSANIITLGILNVILSVLKSNSDGNVVWNKQVGYTSESSWGDGIAVDDSNHVYVTGNYRESAYFDNHTISSNGYDDMFVAKLSDSKLRINDIKVTGKDCGNDSICINLNIKGGAQPYKYSWSNDSVTKDICNITPGNYSVVVKDANECIVDTTVNIFAKQTLSLSITSTNVSKPGATDGVADVTVIGGSAPYAFNWNNTAITEDLHNIPAGNYFVTVTDAFGCTAVSNVIITELDNPLQINLTAIQITCSGTDSSGKINLTATGGVKPYTYVWSNGKKTQNLDSLPVGIYTVTLTDNSTIKLTVSKSIEIKQDKLPVVDIGKDTTIACLSYVSLDAGNKGCTYKWSTGSELQTITVTTIGLIKVSVTNTCGTVTDSIRISINNPAHIIFDTLTCNGDSLLLDAQTLFSQYNWSTGNTTQTSTINTSGNYTVTITNVCGIVADTFKIFTLSTPIADAGLNDSICKGDSIKLTATGGLHYLWNTQDTISVIAVKPTVTSTYTVTILNTFNCTASDTVVITVISLPALPNIEDKKICFNQDTSALLSIIDTSNYFYEWYDAAKGGTLLYKGDSLKIGKFNSDTTFYIQSKTIEGCADTTRKAVSVKLSFLPVVDIGKDSIIECMKSIELNAGNQGNTFKWSTDDTTQYITVSSPALIKVSVTNTCGTVTDSIKISINNPAHIIYDTLTCKGDSLLLDAQTLFSQYNWSTGDTTQTSTINTFGNYTVTITNVCGIVADTFKIFTLSTPIADAGLNDSICKGDSIKLTATGGLHYLWNTQDTISEIAVKPAITLTYMVTISNTFNCTASDTVVITVIPLPSTNISDKQICFNQDTLAQLRIADTSNYFYEWYDAAKGGTLLYKGDSLKIGKFNSDTTFYIQSKTLEGCTDTTRKAVSVKLGFIPIVELGKDTTIECMKSIELDAGNQGSTFKWSTNDTTQNITVSSPTLIKVSVTNTCGTVTDSIRISINNPSVTINDTAICISDSLLLKSQRQFSQYKWSTGDTTQIIYVKTSGQFIVTITNVCGIVADTMNIVFYSKPHADFDFEPEHPSFFTPSVTFNNLSIGNIKTWDWYLNKDSIRDLISTDENPTYSFNNAGDYAIWLVVADTNNCIDSTYKKIYVDNDFTFYAPNAFTPNGDSKNEIFLPQGVGIDWESFKMYIYTRWGEQIYETVPPINYWNGSIKRTGDICPDGVYTWLVIFNDLKGNKHRYVGVVLLIK